MSDDTLWRHNEEGFHLLRAAGFDVRAAAERSKLQDRQASLRLQLECRERDDDQVADLTVKAFDLSRKA